jgi:hypothetical protein
MSLILAAGAAVAAAVLSKVKAQKLLVLCTHSSFAACNVSRRLLLALLRCSTVSAVALRWRFRWIHRATNISAHSARAAASAILQFCRQQFWMQQLPALLRQKFYSLLPEQRRGSSCTGLPLC